MSRARSGSEVDRRAALTSEVVKPGVRVLVHDSNSLSSGVRVRVWGIVGLREVVVVEENGRRRRGVRRRRRAVASMVVCGC